MEETQDMTPTDFYVYKSGICFMSVCVIAAMATFQIEEMANQQIPTGLDHGWTIADEPFETGESNPCKCNNDPKGRKHYLLSC